jgi:hypothetical protein
MGEHEDVYSWLLSGLPEDAALDLRELEKDLPLPSTEPEVWLAAVGLRARLEARWSWASWTDEDIERERSSWQQLVENSSSSSG